MATDQRLLSLYIPVQQAILNYWMGEIPLQETAILLYVNERTLRYGKPLEHINRTHFLDGVHDRQGHLLHNGAGVKQTSLWKYVSSVESRGLVQIIHRPRDMRGNIYELDLTNIMAPVLDGKLQTSSKSRTKGRRSRRVKPRSSSRGD